MHSLFPAIILSALLTFSAASVQAQSPDAGADPVPTVPQLKQWKQCREYVPESVPKDKHSGCRVDFDMNQTKDGKTPPQTHKDNTVYLAPNTRGVVVLWRSSPFAACSLTTQPGPLARDLSSNVSSALTSAAGLAGFVLPAASVLGSEAISADITLTSSANISAENLAPEQAAEITREIQAQVQQKMDFNAHISAIKPADKQTAAQEAESAIKSRIDAEMQKNRLAKAVSIEEQEKEITKALKAIQDVAHLYNNLQPDLDDATKIRQKLSYSYNDNGTARFQINEIEDAAVRIVGRPLPDSKTIPTLQSQRDGVADKIDTLKKQHSDVPDVLRFVKDAQAQIEQVDKVIKNNSEPNAVALVAYVTDTQAKVQKLLDFVRDWKAKDSDAHSLGDASVQVLPIALYSESKVGVTVKCSDAVTGNALFDNIQFNAYFQRAPIFDISAGVLISTLHGRQVTTQTAYTDPATSACPPTTASPTSSCPTVYIKRTRPQFMPGVFAEIHPWNFKLHGVHDPAYEAANPPGQIPTWMSDNAPRHPVGYVGSIGFAGGFMVNPNNGTTQAEFFEGISFGIQRFVILIGNHNGRSQNLTGGYIEGQTVATGTMPETVSNWANGLALGITYRIPLR